MKRKTPIVEEASGCDTWLSTRNRLPVTSVMANRKTIHVKVGRRNHLGRVMSSLQMTPTLTRTTRQTSIAGYLVQPQKFKARNSRQLRSTSSNPLYIPRVKTKAGTRAFSVAAPTLWNSLPISVKSEGNAGEDQSVPPPTRMPTPRPLCQRLSDDKENIPLRKDKSEKNDAGTPKDDCSDVTRLMNDDVVLSPYLRGMSSSDDTSQVTNRSAIMQMSSTRNDDIMSRGRPHSRPQEIVGFYPDTSRVSLGGFESKNESQFTLRSPGKSTFRDSYIVWDDSVGTLASLSDSGFTLNCADSGKNDFTLSTETWADRENSLPKQTDDTEHDNISSDLTEMAFTFHSDGDFAGGRHIPSFRSPTKHRGTFSAALASPQNICYDEDNTTNDSDDLRFTFHSESSQVHIKSDKRNEGSSDFRFSECGSVSSTMELRTCDMSFHA